MTAFSGHRVRPSRTQAALVLGASGSVGKQIAKAMIAASLNPPTTSAVYHYREMMALN